MVGLPAANCSHNRRGRDDCRRCHAADPPWAPNPAAFGLERVGGRIVEVREERDRGVQREAAGLATALQRVRVAVRKAAVGSFVAFKAHQSPPLQPLRPGGNEFARDMYFQRIGTFGYALGTIKIKSAPVAQGFGLRYASIIDAMRDGLDKRKVSAALSTITPARTIAIVMNERCVATSAPESKR